MASMKDGSVDAFVCDPPYDLTTGEGKGFMNKEWDGTGIAFSPQFWDAVFRVLNDDGIVKVFGGTRTFHRMADAMDKAGFTTLDLDGWCYGSGFPKSLNIGKALDKMAGAMREKKKIAYTGNAVLRAGGQNTRPWMEDALQKGFHELDGDDPVSDEAKTWNGWGTALKPAWEPVLLGFKSEAVAALYL